MKTPAEKLICEINEQGAIPFARFMELALYCPVCGYYEKEKDKLGRRGDFVTSVSVGSLFGELLACQFAEWLNGLRIAESAKIRDSHTPRSSQHACRIIEAGAHDGQLARDILTWLGRHQPDLFAQLEYWIVEPSETRRGWQSAALREFESSVRWFRTLTDLPGTAPDNSQSAKPTVVFCNELLDAFPVHRIGWDAGARRWFEWGVTLAEGRFAWTRMPGEFAWRSRRLDLPEALLELLPDGFITEICPAAEEWWSAAADAVACGKLLALDYGLAAEDFFAPQRAEGTLRAYRGHRLIHDVLSCPGEQDLTAHVNFTVIQKAGEERGLKTEAFMTQSQFLARVVERAGTNEALFHWTPARVRQFQTLTHPEHLGRSFRALVQSRG